MVWAHANGDLAIATHVKAPVSTSVPSSAQHATAGTLFRNPSMSQNSATQSGTWPNPRFPPAPPSSPPPTLAYPFPTPPSTPPCSPTLPCPPTQAASPSTPSIPSSQPRQAGTPYTNSPGGHTYGFDPNPHWQEDKDHYDNQKINGLTFPSVHSPISLHAKTGH